LGPVKTIRLRIAHSSTRGSPSWVKFPFPSHKALGKGEGKNQKKCQSGTTPGTGMSTLERRKEWGRKFFSETPKRGRIQTTFSGEGTGACPVGKKKRAPRRGRGGTIRKGNKNSRGKKKKTFGTIDRKKKPQQTASGSHLAAKKKRKKNAGGRPRRRVPRKKKTTGRKGKKTRKKIRDQKRGLKRRGKKRQHPVTYTNTKRGRPTISLWETGK